MAIKPKVFEELYDIYEVEESFVSQDPSDGRRLYGMEGIADCKNFNLKTNEILWENKKYSQPDDKIEYLKKTYGVDLD